MKSFDQLRARMSEVIRRRSEETSQRMLSQIDRRRDLENRLILVMTLLEGIQDILDEKSPGDFLLSFPEVRSVADLMLEAEAIASDIKVLDAENGT